MQDELAQRLQSGLGGNFEVRGEIGRGGWGSVFLAIDGRLGRPVAVKLLQPALARDERFRRRFVREAQVAAQLTHPNIVQVHDVGEHDELVWFVMQFVDGDTVHHWVRSEGPQPIVRAARVLRDAAHALAYAHARGIVHRDIKPGNILLERATGRALVTDFGIAKALVEIGGDTSTGEATLPTSPHLTSTGMLLGTLQYMSPEQATGDPIDGRSDVYSLGLVGYYMIGGRHPRDGDESSLFAQAVDGGLPDSVTSSPAISEWFGTALQRCSAPQVEARYARVEELIEQLSIGIRTHPAHPIARRFVRLAWTHFWVAIAGLGVWGLVGGPPVDPLFVGALAILMAAMLLRVLHHGRDEVAWAEIRQALVEERRLWFEERDLQFERDEGLITTISGVLALLVGPLDPDDAHALLLVIPVVMAPIWFYLFGIWPPLALLTAALMGFAFLKTFGLPEYGDFAAQGRYRRYEFVKPKNDETPGDADYWRLPGWIDWVGQRLFGRAVGVPAGEPSRLIPDRPALDVKAEPADSFARLMSMAKSLLTRLRRLGSTLVRRKR